MLLSAKRAGKKKNNKIRTIATVMVDDGAEASVYPSAESGRVIPRIIKSTTSNPTIPN
jgi:hypothetical protein